MKNPLPLIIGILGMLNLVLAVYEQVFGKPNYQFHFIFGAVLLIYSKLSEEKS